MTIDDRRTGDPPFTAQFILLAVEVDHLKTDVVTGKCVFWSRITQAENSLFRLRRIPLPQPEQQIPPR